MQQNEHLLENRMKEYQGEIKDFTPFAPKSNRTIWNKIPKEIKDQLVRYGEKFLDYNYPILPAKKYMNFVRNGNREFFEEVYFTRRRVLNSLVMAECIEGEGRFFDDILDGLLAVCEESGWQLPSHNRQGNTDTRNLIPDIKKPIIDLFSAETAAQIAMISYLFEDELEAQSPLFTERIRYEIRTRIIDPYFNEFYFWMGEEGRKVNNWNAWCNKNTLIASLCAGKMNQTEKHAFLEKVCKSLDYFITCYSEDGACEEGPHYYHEAGLSLMEAIDVLNQVTDGHFAPIFEVPKIRNIAEYITYVHICGDSYVNYSDGKCHLQFPGARAYLAGKNVHSQALITYGVDTQKNAKLCFSPESVSLYERVCEVWYVNEMNATAICAPLQHEDQYYESIGLFIARDEKIFAAMYGGANFKSHGHNDCGGVILFKEGKPILIDVGVGEYTKMTFSPERFTIWTMQSQYHNVMNFGDVMQKNGRDFRGVTKEVNLGKTVASTTIELAGCYPENTIQSYQRSVTLEKGKRLTITDKLSELKKGTYLPFMTLSCPEWKEHSLFIEGEEILTCGYQLKSIEKIELTDSKMFSDWGECIYRTILEPVQKEVSFMIEE